MSGPRLVDVKLIYTSSLEGKGDEGSPLYRSYSLYTPDGDLVATFDPQHPEKSTATTFVCELGENR